MKASERNPLSVDAALGNPDLASEQRSLLDLIDKLQFAQLDNVKLPQIIAVGDQSAGKSSVLEAITGTPFPRDADACTRFPTEIRLRRAKEESVHIYIIPDKKNRSFEEQERLLRFRAKTDASNSFSDLMRLAIDEITPKDVPGRFVAGDILVVEKRGPKLPLLTVVDLPGLVRIPNKDQSADDIKAINDITDRYMKSSRAIILAVVGGNQDYTQAPVLQKARTFDPTGERTIGVLTKPDLTEPIGLENKFLALVNNKDKYYQFDLGWYVLINPGPREPGQDWPLAEERRQAEESFFATGKWSTLPQEMCGATALKQKLSAQLQRHIGRHVRTLQREIQKAHDDCVAELKLLGTGKDTIEEMKEELVELSANSKELVSPAVQGTYTNPVGTSFFPKSVNQTGTPPQKLRARVVEENRRFAQRVRLQGRKIRFSSDEDPQAMGHRDSRVATKQDFARDEVEPLLQQNMGTEFPMDHNPRLAYTLFQSYSENWSEFAQQHKDAVGVICNEFLSEVIDYIWPRRMQEPLRKELLDPHMKNLLEEAQKEVEKLAQDQHFEIQPYGDEYEERLKEWRARPTASHSYTEAEELLEKMLIYYELSVKVFIQNVITQVVERHLLQGLHGIFSWLWIHRMPDQTVEAIAAENKETRDARMALKAKKVAIGEARDICASLGMRKDLRMSARDELSNHNDSSDDENASAPATSERLNPHSSLRRKRIGHSQNPLKPPRQSSDEDRGQVAAHTPNTSTNTSVDLGYGRDDGPGPGPGLGVNYSPAVPQRPPKIPAAHPIIPGGWDMPPTNEHNPNTPGSIHVQPDSGYATPNPPPPTTGSGRLQPGGRQLPPSPPDSTSRQTASVYPPLNPNFSRTSPNGLDEEVARKPQRRFFPNNP